MIITFTPRKRNALTDKEVFFSISSTKSEYERKLKMSTKIKITCKLARIFLYNIRCTFDCCPSFNVLLNLEKEEL